MRNFPSYNFPPWSLRYREFRVMRIFPHRRKTCKIFRDIREWSFPPGGCVNPRKKFRDAEQNFLKIFPLFSLEMPNWWSFLFKIQNLYNISREIDYELEWRKSTMLKSTFASQPPIVPDSPTYEDFKREFQPGISSTQKISTDSYQWRSKRDAS